jgi:hypothetical protein
MLGLEEDIVQSLSEPVRENALCEYELELKRLKWGLDVNTMRDILDLILLSRSTPSYRSAPELHRLTLSPLPNHQPLTPPACCLVNLRVWDKTQN